MSRRLFPGHPWICKTCEVSSTRRTCWVCGKKCDRQGLQHMINPMEVRYRSIPWDQPDMEIALWM